MRNYLLSIVLISFGIGQANVTSVAIDTVQLAYGLFSPTTTPIAYNSQSGFGVVIRADYDLFTFRSGDGLNWEQDDFIDQVYPRYPSTTLSDDGAMITTWVNWNDNQKAFYRFNYLNHIDIYELPCDATSFIVKPQLLEDDDNWYLHSLSEDYTHNSEYYHPLTISKTPNYQGNTPECSEFASDNSFTFGKTTFKLNNNGQGALVSTNQDTIKVWQIIENLNIDNQYNIILNHQNYPLLSDYFEEGTEYSIHHHTFLIGDNGMQHLFVGLEWDNKDRYAYLHLKKDFNDEGSWLAIGLGLTNLSSFEGEPSYDYGIMSSASMSTQDENVLWFIYEQEDSYTGGNKLDITIKKTTDGGIIWDFVGEVDSDSSLSSPYKLGHYIHAPEKSSDNSFSFIYQNPLNPDCNPMSELCFDYEWIVSIGVYSFGGFPPVIDPVDDQEIEEDTNPFLFVTGTFDGSISDYTLYAYSDTADVYVIDEPGAFGNGWRFRTFPTENWFGEATITLILAENETGLADTTSFQVTVLPVNDSPEPFSLIYPTVTDTISIHTDTDETIQFSWEESVDVDSEVNYITTVTLDYFGDTYSDTYESNEPMVEVSPYEWAVLMTNLELERWTLEYTVQASDEEYTVETEGEFVFQNNTLSVENDITPLSFRLHQNYPNPFNPVTTVRYELPEDSFVDVTVYDMLGNVVNTLINTNQSSGYKSIQWNATNNQGEPVSAGVYLYKIQAGDFVDTKKMILLK